MLTCFWIFLGFIDQEHKPRSTNPSDESIELRLLRTSRDSHNRSVGGRRPALSGTFIARILSPAISCGGPSRNRRGEVHVEQKTHDWKLVLDNLVHVAKY